MKTGAKVGVAVVLLAGVGVGGWTLLARGRGNKPKWQTAKVWRGNLTAQVTATGTLQPVLTSPVGAQVSGIIYKYYADFNSPVKEGQILVELDPALFKNAVQQADAQLANCVANEAKAAAALVDAQRIRDRNAALAKDHFVAQSDADTADANYLGAQAQVKAAQAATIQAKASLARAKLDLEHSVIRAPVTGTVISRNVDVGQAVAASFTAPTLFTIAKDLSKMQVHANIDEADIGQVKEGEFASFTVDAFRGEKFRAKVSQVRNAPQTVQNVVTYDVVMDVDNPDLKLRPGMTANVKIISAKKEDILMIPNTALRFKPPLDGKDGKDGKEGGKTDPSAKPASAGGGSGNGGGGGGGWGGHKRGEEQTPGIYVPDGEGVKKIPVEVGITDGNSTEVKNLSEGQEVVVDVVREKGSPSPSASPMGGGGPGRGFGRGF
jgi:HlyD family secretion protein